MSFTPYRSFIQHALAPTVLQGFWGQRLICGVIGIVFDSLIEACRLGVKNWMILSREVGPDTLGLHGAARRLTRYQGETDAVYKERLAKVWALWAQAGSPQIIVSELLHGFGVVAEVQENHGWDWDGHPERWARFWTVLLSHRWAPWLLGGAEPHLLGESGLTIGSTATATEVNGVRALIRQWKPAHVQSEWIIVVMDAAKWAASWPAGDWDERSKRSDGAIYWAG